MTTKRCDDTTTTWDPNPQYCAWGTKDPQWIMLWGFGPECECSRTDECAFGCTCDKHADY